MFKLPQEIEVWYIIPKIRSEIAKKLVEKKVSYEKIAEILGITKSAVTHYTKNKRANKIKLSKEIQKEIDSSLKKILEKKSNFLIEIQRLLKLIRKSKCSCNVCKEYNKEVLNYCNCDPSY
ncbi:MAG: hypothetical protein QXX68_02205 [Candidatus Pacearchaeota archaeon]